MPVQGVDIMSEEMQAKLKEVEAVARELYAMVDRIAADDTKFQEAVAKAFDVDGGINVEDVPI